MNMATVKVLLRTSKLNEQGLAPLYLRLIKDRKAKFISLKIYLKPSEWNEEAGKVRKSHPNSARMNALIAQRIADAEGVAVEMETKSKTISSYRIKEKIIGAAAVDFFDYAQKHLNNMQKTGAIGTYMRFNTIIGKLKKYCNNKPLYFDEITVTFLKDYEQHLIDEYKNRTNTIHSNLRAIRTVIIRAVNEDIITRNDNPFYKFKLKLEKTKREFLHEDEIQRIENVELPTKGLQQLHRDMYVFAVYAGGLRVSDCLLLRWSNFDGEHVHVQMHKTKSVVTVKLPNKALEILMKYKNEGSLPEQFVFPVLPNNLDFTNAKLVHTSICNAVSSINKSLKNIAKKAEVNKNVSFHTSRHTFATWALRKGIRIEYVSKLLGHANIKDTQIYAKIVNEELDKAMEVFNT
jgi:Site-specific recombinase XerD